MSRAREIHVVIQGSPLLFTSESSGNGYPVDVKRVGKLLQYLSKFSLVCWRVLSIAIIRRAGDNKEELFRHLWWRCPCRSCGKLLHLGWCLLCHQRMFSDLRQYVFNHTKCKPTEKNPWSPYCISRSVFLNTSKPTVWCHHWGKIHKLKTRKQCSPVSKSLFMIACVKAEQSKYNGKKIAARCTAVWQSSKGKIAAKICRTKDAMVTVSHNCFEPMVIDEESRNEGDRCRFKGTFRQNPLPNCVEWTLVGVCSWNSPDRSWRNITLSTGGTFSCLWMEPWVITAYIA